MRDLARFREFIHAFTRLLETAGDDEPRIFEAGGRLLVELVRHDDWLPAQFAEPDAERYRQNLLYCDPRERFSVLSVVLARGQQTPVHDHTVWGMVGVMRGAERCVEYLPAARGAELRPTGEHRLEVGAIDRVSPRIGDVHRVCNASDIPSVSIHVYGANIGALRRHLYDPHSGDARPFVSGYSLPVLPNIWEPPPAGSRSPRAYAAPANSAPTPSR